VTFAWERLGDGVFRCRLPFLDVTVGLVYGRAGAMLIDSGTTLTEARAIAEDVQDISSREISHIVLTHNHFDHVLGAAAFLGSEIFCAPEVAVTMAERSDHLRAEAVRYGADAGEVGGVIAALRVPEHQVTSAVVDLGDRTVSISHPGRGHTSHDLIAVVTGSDRPVVFCGDLAIRRSMPTPILRRGRRRWTWSSRRGVRMRCSCRATARWSTRRSSTGSKAGCGSKCDEFQIANVT
jgi:glyoxylase-like metal-dependent hydrolase (beta-lactamase superfamily II)